MAVDTYLAEAVALRHLLPEAVFFGAEQFRIRGCTCDTRRLRPGDLFVAIDGTADDGHRHLAEAVAAGAVAVVTAHPVTDLPVPVCQVPDTAEAFGRICQALAGNPSRRLKVVGITGTNGKTTTSWLVHSVLSAAGYSSGLLGTLGCFDGQDWSESAWTTPPADVLAHCLRRMADHACTHAVMEVSSHALAQSRVAGVDFDAAGVTNVRRDHLDYHQTLQGYRQAKSRLFRHLAPEGFAVINADDPVAAGYLSLLDGPVLTIGIDSAAEITATIVEQFSSEQTFLLTAGSDAIPVRTRMVGRHHVSNCLIAAAMGLAYGIDLPTVVQGLEAVQNVPGRLERIECGQPYSVFVDYAHTPDALAAVLDTLRELTAGRLICVFGAGGGRDRQKRPLMGREVESRADVVIVTTDNPRDEDPAAIAQEIEAGFSRPAQARRILDRGEAIAWALRQARTGDCVLVAGKGHERGQMIGSQCRAFDDREFARTWLYENLEGPGTLN